jgi:hypothetical protein
VDPALSQRGQMASHLAHNQKRVSSILTAAIFQPRSVVQQHDASLIRRKRWGGTTRSDFVFQDPDLSSRMDFNPNQGGQPMDPSTQPKRHLPA